MNARIPDRTERTQARSSHTVSIIAMALVALVLGIAPGFDTVPVAHAAIAGWCTTSLRPADIWNTLTVDMTVKHQRLTSAGNPLGVPSPNATYRLERSSRSGSWKTVVTVLSVERPPIYSFSGALTPPKPIPVARIEDDENGAAVRAYDANGALITPTLLANTSSPTSTARTTGLQWLDAFVAAPGRKNVRQQAFERLYGKAVKAGTFNKYARTVTNGADEVLVDPKTVVPVEANATRNGKRLAHRTFVYGPAPDLALVRTNVHTDTTTTPSSGDRAIVDTTFSNVCLEFRR